MVRNTSKDVETAAQWARTDRAGRSRRRQAATARGTQAKGVAESAAVAALFLNIDAGEHPGEPDPLYAAAHAVSIACGGHAGDEASMDRVLRACARLGTRAGAHPSYADRGGFGRRGLGTPAREVEPLVMAQCASLAARARLAGVTISHVKAHGALYHAANEERAIADAVLGGARKALGERILVLGPPDGALRDAALALGLGFAREGFADRGTRADGSLLPRGEPGALLVDPREVAARARALAASGAFDTLCVHGDSPGALDLARAVRAALDAR